MASVRGTSPAATTACSAGDTGRGIVMPVAALFSFGAVLAAAVGELAVARTATATEARRGGVGAREVGRRGEGSEHGGGRHLGFLLRCGFSLWIKGTDLNTCNTKG